VLSVSHGSMVAKVVFKAGEQQSEQP